MSDPFKNFDRRFARMERAGSILSGFVFLWIILCACAVIGGGVWLVSTGPEGVAAIAGKAAGTLVRSFEESKRPQPQEPHNGNKPWRLTDAGRAALTNGVGDA